MRIICLILFLKHYSNRKQGLFLLSIETNVFLLICLLRIFIHYLLFAFSKNLHIRSTFWKTQNSCSLSKIAPLCNGTPLLALLTVPLCFRLLILLRNEPVALPAPWVLPELLSHFTFWTRASLLPHPWGWTEPNNWIQWIACGQRDYVFFQSKP